VFTDKANLGGGESLLFKKMGKPADGARAKRSNRDQQDAIHLVFPEQAGQIACHWLHPHGVSGTHERVVKIGHASNGGSIYELPEPIEREYDVPVLLETGAVEIYRDVAHDQIVSLHVARNNPVLP